MHEQNLPPKKFPHAFPRHDLRQWGVILSAAGFIAFFAPSVSGGNTQIVEAVFLILFGVVTWVGASYLPMPKLKRKK